MRSPPSVRVEVAWAGLWSLAEACFAGLTSAVLLLLFGSHVVGTPDGGWLLCCLAAVLGSSVCALIWRRARTLPKCCLDWDGVQWTLLQAGSAPVGGHWECVLDAQDWIVLRWWNPERRGRGSIWLPLSRGVAGASWHALRCALHWSLQRPAADLAPARGRP